MDVHVFSTEKKSNVLKLNHAKPLQNQKGTSQENKKNHTDGYIKRKKSVQKRIPVSTSWYKRAKFLEKNVA